MRDLCYLLLLAEMVLIAPNSHASPTESIVIREIFIGSNDAHYYYYLIKTHNPGSYYNSSDSVFLCKNEIASGQMKMQLLLRTVVFESDPVDNNWTRTHTMFCDISVEVFLMNERVYYSFQSDLQVDYVFGFYEGALYLGKDNKRALLQDSIEIGKHMIKPLYFDLPPVRIQDVFEQGGAFIFLLLQYGESYGEYNQSIMTLRRSKFDGVAAELDKS